jgi:hypothetical protein
MATVLKGLTPYKKKGGDPFTGGRSRYLIKNSYGTALAVGDPVKVSAGFIEVAVNTTNGCTGVFAGCKYIDSTTKQPVESTLWTASTSSGGAIEGETHAIGYVFEGTDLTFLAEADASVSATLVGSTFPVSVGTPDSIVKRSKARVHASVNSSVGGNMVRLLGFPNISGSAADAAATIVEVEIVAPGMTPVA